MNKLSLYILVVITLFSCSSEDEEINGGTVMNGNKVVVIDKLTRHQQGRDVYILTVRYGYDDELARLLDRHKLGVLTDDELTSALKQRVADPKRELETRTTEMETSGKIWHSYERGAVMDISDLPGSISVHLDGAWHKDFVITLPRPPYALM